MSDHLGRKLGMAAARKALALAYPAQVDDDADIQPIDQVEIGIAGVAVLARTIQ